MIPVSPKSRDAIAALVRDIADNGRLRREAAAAAAAALDPADRPRLKAQKAGALLKLALAIWAESAPHAATRRLRAGLAPWIQGRSDILAQVERWRGAL